MSSYPLTVFSPLGRGDAHASTPSHTSPDRRRSPQAAPQIANAPSSTHQRSQAMVRAVRSGRVRLRCCSNCCARRRGSAVSRAAPPLSWAISFISFGCAQRSRRSARFPRTSKARHARQIVLVETRDAQRVSPLGQSAQGRRSTGRDSCRGARKRTSAAAADDPPVELHLRRVAGPVADQERRRHVFIGVEAQLVGAQRQPLRGQQAHVGHEPADQAPPQRTVDFLLLAGAPARGRPSATCRRLPRRRPGRCRRADRPSRGWTRPSRRRCPSPGPRPAPSQASGRAVAASEGSSASWILSAADGGQPSQRLAGAGQLHVESRFGRRYPAHGHQFSQPLADLRRRRTAEADQRPLAFGQPFPQVRQRVVGQKDLGVSAEDDDLIGGQRSGVGEEFSRVLLDGPLLAIAGGAGRAIPAGGRGLLVLLGAELSAADFSAAAAWRGMFRCSSRPSASCTTLVSATDGSADKVRTRNFVSQYGLPSKSSTRTGWSTTRSSSGARC